MLTHGNKPKNEASRLAVTNILVGDGISSCDDAEQLWAYQEDDAWHILHHNGQLAGPYSPFVTIFTHRAIDVDSKKKPTPFAGMGLSFWCAECASPPRAIVALGAVSQNLMVTPSMSAICFLMTSISWS
jgi:hypothetical protein